MRAARLATLAVVSVVLACGGDAPSPGPRQLPSGIPDGGSLIRLPSDGGRAKLYRADSLTPLDWRMRGELPPIARVLGADLDDRMVYAVDTEGEVIGIDLVAHRQRRYLQSVRRPTGTADGAVLALDSTGQPLIFQGRTATSLPGEPPRGRDVILVRAPGLSPGAATYSAAANLFEVRKESGIVARYTVPAGQLASSWFGDVQVITTDSGLVVIEPGDSAVPAFIRLKGAPITSAFSPSAHRLYVARAGGDIIFLDRFDWSKVATLELPGRAVALRPDRSGRWLLARPAVGDSVWVIDLVRKERVTTLVSPWGGDLPLISGGRTLVVRSGDDVVAWDILASPPVPRARLVGAAKDHFLQVPWSPAGTNAGEAQEVADAFPGEAGDSVTVASGDSADQAPGIDAADSTGGEQIYIQLSQSQNAGWARAQAKQLIEIGYPAHVLNPRAEGDGYRVVAGPYPSRDAADADGKRLGRPYFVMKPQTTGP